MIGDPKHTKSSLLIANSQKKGSKNEILNAKSKFVGAPNNKQNQIQNIILQQGKRQKSKSGFTIQTTDPSSHASNPQIV